ncbi:MAG TPA: hypothetical protein VFI74_02860 [Candidatus Saccharimonadales bacterium]|nr:hypothetical protein [Candidatus Saccharimonadales bacterium]
MKQQGAETRYHQSFSWGDEGQFLMATLHATPHEGLVEARRQPGVQIVGGDPLIAGSAVAIESSRKTIEWAMDTIEDGRRIEFVAQHKQKSDLMGGVALARYEDDINGPARVSLSFWRTSEVDVRTMADMCQAAIMFTSKKTTFGAGITDAELRIPSSDHPSQRVAVELGARTTGQLFFNGIEMQNNPARAAYHKWSVKVGEA